VVIVKKNREKTAIPIEVKAWVSPNTFHRTVSRFNKRQGLSDMPGIGSNASVSADGEKKRKKQT